MRELIIKTTPLFGVVKFFSNEKKFGFAIINGEEYFFHLDSQTRTAICFNNSDPVLTLYVGVSEVMEKNFFLPKKGDKIFVLSKDRTKITFWTSEEEFLSKLEILQKLERYEPQKRFVSKGEDKSCGWMPQSIVYTNETEPLAREGYIRRLSLENGVATPSKGTPDYPNFFIIEELRNSPDGEYIFNEELERYEKILS